MRYACVTCALRIAVLLVCLSRGRSGITRGSTAFDNLTAFCNLSFLLPFTHHLGFPILGRSNIDVRFTVVTVKFIRGLFMMISPDMKKQNIPRGKTILLLTMQLSFNLNEFYFVFILLYISLLNVNRKLILPIYFIHILHWITEWIM